MHSFFSILRSIRVWTLSVLLILIWLPLLGCVRLFDRTQNRMKTGLWFRRLGRALTRVNPFWQLKIIGSDRLPGNRAFVVVSNHQSLADIPLISNLQWEMKWVAKEELFRVPVIGWMMALAGDIPVDRVNARSGARMLMKAKEYLTGGCSVMFFPEGTRSKDGSVGGFSDGAFYLAKKAGVPILPLAVEGSHRCLPKNSWLFGQPATVRMRVFDPVETVDVPSHGIPQLREAVRTSIIEQIEEWRTKDNVRPARGENRKNDQQLMADH